MKQSTVRERSEEEKGAGAGQACLAFASGLLGGPRRQALLHGIGS